MIVMQEREIWNNVEITAENFLIRVNQKKKKKMKPKITLVIMKKKFIIAGII